MLSQSSNWFVVAAHFASDASAGEKDFRVTVDNQTMTEAKKLGMCVELRGSKRGFNWGTPWFQTSREHDFLILGKNLDFLEII